MSKIQINDLNIENFSTLTELESASIQGGFYPSILDISSGAGHIGRAFAFGYAIGTGIKHVIDNSAHLASGSGSDALIGGNLGA
jgi:hypothetical protein